MMETMKLDKNNYLIYAAENYQNLHCTSISDFHKDVKVFITARTLLRLYHKNGNLKIRLLVNHIITCTNVFGPKATVRLFFFHCEEELHPSLVSIFEYLSILPERIPEADLRNIDRNSDLQRMLEDL